MAEDQSLVHRTQRNNITVPLSCAVCNRISSFITVDKHKFNVWDSDKHELKLGDWRDLVASGCQQHVALLTACLTFGINETPRGKVFIRKKPWSNVWDTTQSPYERSLDISCVCYSLKTRLSAVSSSPSSVRSSSPVWSYFSPSCGSTAVATGPRRKVDSSWIDTGIITSWKNTCTCGAPPTPCSAISRAHDRAISNGRLLVDVDNFCLVQALPSHEYVALSYTWDHNEHFVTQAADLSSLHEMHSLVPVFHQLAPTIQTTIRLVRTLKEHYLWVDQLCIIQDNETQKHAEIASMSDIYANASLTIIAAHDVGGGSGINGLRNLMTAPRTLEPTDYQIGNVSLIYPTCYRSDLPPSAWSQRAWTFQEDMFSDRRLVFQNDSVYWECKCSVGPVWEDWYWPSGYPGEIGVKLVDQDPYRHSLTSSVPTIDVLAKIITKYNHRELSFEEDALLAFAGILEALRNSYPGGFISGLPQHAFDVALLWTPTTYHMRRRKPSQRVVGQSYLPSWSWAGWKGAIKWSEGDYLVGPWAHGRVWSLEFTPTVSWYIIDAKQESTEICCTWTEFRGRYRGSDEHLPPDGWQRHHIETHSAALSSALPYHKSRWTYKHHMHPEIEFEHPVPLLENEGTPEDNILARHISCYTKRAYFKADRFICELRPTISVLSYSDGWAGILNLHDRPREAEQLDMEELVGQTLEFVEVGKGSVRNFERDPQTRRMEEWMLHERPDDGEFYSFVHVLWIAWEDGVAYRKGVGRVEQRMWEAEDPDKIDLILG